MVDLTLLYWLQQNFEGVSVVSNPIQYTQEYSSSKSNNSTHSRQRSILQNDIILSQGASKEASVRTRNSGASQNSGDSGFKPSPVEYIGILEHVINEDQSFTSSVSQRRDEGSNSKQSSSRSSSTSQVNEIMTEEGDCHTVQDTTKNMALDERETNSNEKENE